MDLHSVLHIVCKHFKVYSTDHERGWTRLAHTFSRPFLSGAQINRTCADVHISRVFKGKNTFHVNGPLNSDSLAMQQHR